MKEFIELKTAICTALGESISNSERQKLGELFSLIDVIILNKFGRVDSKDYNTLYKELTASLIKNPKNTETKLIMERLRSIKNLNVSEDGFIYMKLLQIKLILEGYNNTPKVVELINKLNCALNEQE